MIKKYLLNLGYHAMASPGQGVWKSRALSARRWSQNFEWMNKWIKHFGLQTLHWSRKFFSDALHLAIVGLALLPAWDSLHENTFLATSPVKLVTDQAH